jgi:hypothetical protein
MNPGSFLYDERVEFASIDAVINDLLEIVSSRSTITSEEVEWCGEPYFMPGKHS